MLVANARNLSDVNALHEVGVELRRARAVHADLRSAHEAYAVILDFLEEFWAEVKKHRELRTPEALRQELTQIAAMAVRALVDLGLVTEEMA